MYTLKIRWTRHEQGQLADETNLFIAADEVHVHAHIPVGSDTMKEWPEGSYFDYRNVVGSAGDLDGGRLIQVNKDNSTWYLASLAWLLGPDGKTIERIAP